MSIRQTMQASRPRRYPHQTLRRVKRKRRSVLLDFWHGTFLSYESCCDGAAAYSQHSSITWSSSHRRVASEFFGLKSETPEEVKPLHSSPIDCNGPTTIIRIATNMPRSQHLEHPYYYNSAFNASSTALSPASLQYRQYHEQQQTAHTRSMSPSSPGHIRVP